ncbi:ribokinase [Ferrimonas sp. SCSIO 43195]|uniref:ribokinase n=1 Tax=Ferrimonas sp. SCSIO 43195 TaxID=2822844 RepID=UPI0020750BEE|nr:ribokinase [Ferrimonas sp. SCSIO 43195]USD39069.1 ribokinase [Ferrimonas sp. SCSIO 43195]
MATLTVLGSINVDYVMQVAAFPRPGQTIEAKRYQIVGGGKGANQAVAAAKLGGKVAMIGCVGDDAIGAQLTQEFAATGLDVSAITAVAGEATGLAMIYVDDKGENSIGIWPGANGCLSPQLASAHREFIEQSQLLLMQLETPIETLIEAAAIAKAANTQVVLNPAPAKALPDALLAHVDIITPNETEAEQLTGIAVDTLDDADRAAQALHQRFGIDMVLITMGKRGVWLSQAGQGQLLAGFEVKAVDTTAAGDTFNGGFVTALLEGQSVIDAVAFGQAAAAMSVTRVGAQSSIPSRDEALALVNTRASL